jgi:hypothetical protein
LERLENQASAIDEKESSLLRLRSDFSANNLRMNDSIRFIKDLITGSDYGWNQVEARRTTFSELLGSGRFSLIRDSRLREIINEYYDFDSSVHERIDARETDFPHLSYLLIPRENEGTVDGVRGLAEIESALTEVEIDRLVSSILASPIEGQLVGELNLARYLRNVGQRVQSRCRDLISELEAYREVIR